VQWHAGRPQPRPHCVNKRKGKEEYLYSAFLHQGTHKALRHGSHSFTCKQHHACLSFASVHQMAPPQQLRQQTSKCSLLLIYRPWKDERLSWPGWLTCSGWFTHLSGHPSTTARAQDSKRMLAKDSAPLPQNGLEPPIFGPYLLSQMARWIKMPLGMEVRLSPNNIVLDGDPAPPPQKGTEPPQFLSHICCGQMAWCIKMPLGREVGLSPSDITYPYTYPHKKPSFTLINDFVVDS